jgi:hypothetical protein
MVNMNYNIIRFCAIIFLISGVIIVSYLWGDVQIPLFQKKETSKSSRWIGLNTMSPLDSLQEKKIDNAIYTEEGIDISDWKTYQNDKYGFKLKYPKDWNITESDLKIIINSDNYKMGLAVTIEKIDFSLIQFTNNYNNSDPTSKILKQQQIFINNNVPAIKLLASTSLGIEDTFIYINNNGIILLIKYNDFSKTHNEIIASLKIIN